MEIVTSDARIFIYIYIAILLLDILNVIERIEDWNFFFLLFHYFAVEEDVTTMNNHDEILCAHYFYTLLALWVMILNVY